MKNDHFMESYKLFSFTSAMSSEATDGYQNISIDKEEQLIECLLFLKRLLFFFKISCIIYCFILSEQMIFQLLMVILLKSLSLSHSVCSLWLNAERVSFQGKPEPVKFSMKIISNFNSTPMNICHDNSVWTSVLDQATKKISLQQFFLCHHEKSRGGVRTWAQRAAFAVKRAAFGDFTLRKEARHATLSKTIVTFSLQ